jgi:hypothetical protein
LAVGALVVSTTYCAGGPLRGAWQMNSYKLHRGRSSLHSLHLLTHCAGLKSNWWLPLSACQQFLWKRELAMCYIILGIPTALWLLLKCFWRSPQSQWILNRCIISSSSALMGSRFSTGLKLWNDLQFFHASTNRVYSFFITSPLLPICYFLLTTFSRPFTLHIPFLASRCSPYNLTCRTAWKTLMSICNTNIIP